MRRFGCKTPFAFLNLQFFLRKTTAFGVVLKSFIFKFANFTQALKTPRPCFLHPNFSNLNLNLSGRIFCFKQISAQILIIFTST